VPDVPSPPPVAQTATVVLLIAGRSGPAFPLARGEDNVFGRSSDSLVTLADRLASRSHAAIRHDPATAAWRVRDLGSRNGTWLDGARVSEAPLADGSLIRIGTTELIFRLDAPVAEPTAASGGRQVIRCGTPAELEGAALTRAGGGDEPRWPMLLYQAGIRLLAAGSQRDIICTTLELAAECTAAASFAWLEPGDDGRPLPACVVPPGTDLPSLVAGSAWDDALAGRAVWLTADSSLDAELACVPLLDGQRPRAVLAAAGRIGELDFDLLVALASFAAAAGAGLERRGPPGRIGVAEAATTEPLDDALAVGGDDDAAAGPADGTLALSATELELLRGGAEAAESPAAAASLRLADWERLLAIEALRRTGGSVPEAAALLGISRATLYRRLDAYGLTRDGSPDQS
jgi:hypothetical protein